MNCEIITIGDELLIGQVVDTNSAWMAQRLNEWGIELKQITSVHDDEAHIVEALEAAFGRADIVLTTGGLGPTKDDITKKVLCDYFGTCLVANEEVHQHILRLYANRPDVLNRLTATQWLVPQNADILTNRVGSAPIMVFQHKVKGKRKLLMSMPGVPYEMQIAMEEQIAPYLRSHTLDTKATHIVHRHVMVYGIPESALALRIEEWESKLPQNTHLAYLPKDGIIRLRLSGYDVETAIVDSEISKLLPLIRDYVVATEDTPLEMQIGQYLKKQGATIAIAESCTGGKLAVLLNKHAGSSAFYKGSVVAYANEVKTSVLGVQQKDLQEYGAVSESIVKQMAEGVRKLLHADYAIATSGIAGPEGGSKDKPVGTVWIAWATPQKTWAECFHLGKLREQITDRAVTTALVKMLKDLQN